MKRLSETGSQNIDTPAFSDATAAHAAMGDALATLHRHAPPDCGPDLAAISAALDRIGARIGSRIAGPPTGQSNTLEASARLDRLLELAGPHDAAELLRRLDEDLASAAQRIRTAEPVGDTEAIRAATHVLMSLAGSVGALTLETAARRLNQAAQSVDVAPGSASEQVIAGIASLRQALTARNKGATG